MRFLRHRKTVPKETAENVIILDTCALQSNKSIEVIDQADKVILLLGVIEEMDKFKKAGGVFGKNIAKVSMEARKDTESEKYITAQGYEFYNHTDNNIFSYCIDNPNVTILTSDNLLCVKAKAYQIPYKFIELGEAENYFKEGNNLVEITGTEFINGKLCLYEKLDSRINFLYRDKKYLSNAKNELQVGDVVYQLKYKENGFYFTIVKYKIEELDESHHARYMARIKINSSNLEELEEFGLPKEVKGKGYVILNSKEEGKEEEYSKKRELLYKVRRAARINKYNQFDVIITRGEEILDINSCEEGDFVYVLKYMKQTVTVYKYLLLDDLLFNGRYKVTYVNEIYGNGFGEQLEEEIRKKFLQNC